MTTRNYRWLVGCICGATALVSGLVHSQTSNGDPPDNDIGGNDSPSGVSGGFNGMVNTACAYDPYTGNARRVVDDIIVPGTLGAYPLKWTRFYNSRDPDVGNALGIAWRHSYLWSEDYYGGDIVRFPDGREVDFNEATGIAERLPEVGHLILGDGGQVIFEAVPYTINGHQYAKYRVARIIDPYGLATTISYDNVGTDNNGNAIYRISRITEPGGRYLLLNYSAADGTHISGVQAFTADNNLTQSVSYAYSSISAVGGVYATLTAASYSDSTTAQYTYQNDNSGKSNSPKIPLLRTCDDVRYSGAMGRIDYLFVQGDRIRGKIKSELKGGSGQAVSTLTFPSHRTQTRVETRGDGPKRTFTYSASGRLLSYTDFKNNASIATKLAYDVNNFVGAVTDAGNHRMSYTKEAVTGRITRVVQADQTSYIDFDYGDPNNPYYLWWNEDENRHRTYFFRDANHRVQQINYPGPDTPYETYAYNSFGQILTHRRRNGSYEHFIYDGEGHLRKAWNPTATASWPPSDAESHLEYDYYPNGHPWADRVSTVTDQAGHSTVYEYDRDSASQPCAGRGLVTRMTHLVDGTYTSFAYDQFGNVIAAENELRKRTNFAYDDYSRLITVTPPAPAGPTTVTYERSGTNDPYLHTSRAVHLQTNGAGVTVEKRYDENFQPNVFIQQDGTASPPTTTLEYWPVGPLKTVHDPRNSDWTTSYTYTARNQRETVTDALNHQVTLHYDPAGNVDYIDRPDSKRETRTYDEMNRLVTAIEPVTDTSNRTTTYTYWPSGRVKTVEDSNHQITRIDYDYSDRQQYMFYPDNTFQQWDYDGTGILRGRRTLGGKIQRFQPDARNRITDTWWDPGDSSQWAHFDYDAANQLIGARNQGGTITRQYDDAGRLLTEEQNLYGLGAKTVSYGSDGAGKRLAMGIVGTDYQFGYHYDTLGRLDQLLDVQNSATGPTASTWYQYSYDAASNETQRFCTLNGVAQTYERDELGRIADLKVQNIADPKYPGTPQPVVGGVPVLTNVPPLIDALVTNAIATVQQTVPIGTVISQEHHTYDTTSHVTNVQGLVGNDTFTYDYSGQLATASYSHWNNGGTRSVSYTQDPLGNRNQVNDNGSVQGYSPVATYRNQYASAPAGGVSNGNEHEVAGYEGLSYTFIGDRQLASIIGNGSSYALVYDALGRCVKRTLNGTTIYYTYDGPHPIYEWKADGTKAGWNLYGRAIDEILLRGDFQVLSNGQGYFFQQNRLGSVTHLTGFAGEIIESYRCDAFGQPTTSYTGGSFNNRFKFTGREYQEAFGIYEYRNRAYHPGLGRFLSEDPIGSATGDTNLFRYCGNDPVNCTDPSGLWQVTIFAGHGFGGVFTFGSNSGQWNSGVFMGAGEGAFINVNLKEQAAVPPNGGGAVLATAGAGAVAAGLRMTVYVGHDENYATGSGRLGPASDGLKWDGKSWTNTGGSITLGGGVFIGAGVTAHEPIESTKIPAPGGSTFVDPNDCAAPDCATTERVTVTATYLNLGPYLELGTTYWDSNGNPFHAGTTGNIINGQAFTVSNWFPSLTSSGGGDWQTAGYFPSGGEPGEGSWASLVSPEKY